MTAHSDPDRLIRAYLEEGQTVLPDRVYDALRFEIERTGQRVMVVPWRTWIMNKFLAYGLAAAAILVVALIGFNVLGGTNSGDQPPATPSPTPIPTTTSTAAPTDSGGLSGAIQPGQHEATEGAVAFSFTTEQTGWNIDPDFGLLQKGNSDSYHWIAFFQPFDSVATNPCAAEAAQVGPSVDDFATAMTAIPGTDAEVTETTVGGLPAKLVVLTFQAGIACGPQSFYLYGQNSAYPESFDGMALAWIVEVGGTRYVIQTMQSSQDEAITAEIRQIVDSIEFR